MVEAPGTNELRIFISSTFRDLADEREYLVKKVFPQIRARCRQRGVVFTEIDLRWGLTEEEGALGRVIRTCLEEVDRCRPFFIGLIGDRYGWVPPMHEIMMDPDLLYRYPWIEEAAIEGVSLTDLEIRHGVFTHRFEEGESAYFYHRRETSGADGPGDARLADLVGRIERSGHPLRAFASLEELGGQVAGDLEEVIERTWPTGREPTPIEVQRRNHTAFAASRRRSYIAMPEHIAAFRRWIETGSGPLVVSGRSGLGKSSLVAWLGELFTRDRPEGTLIEHYVGASESTGSSVSVMRHLIEEIRDRCAPRAEVPSSSEEIASTFEDWLLMLDRHVEQSGRPVLIIIDALNQLGAEGRTLAWLPRLLPPRISLLLSTTPGATDEVTRERGWERLEVEPIEETRIRQSIVVRYLGEFHKGISAEQLARIAGDRNAPWPLFLCLVAEELRLHGEHETLDEEIDRYCNLPSLDAVFQVLLERLERDFGVNLVRDFFSLLALSRSGLTEPELVELLDAPRVDLSRLLFALDYHLIRKEGLLDFFHIYLRHGVEGRYLSSDAERRQVHTRLARYWSRLLDRDYGAEGDPPVRLALEACYQSYRADDREHLVASLVRLPVVRSLVRADRSYELLEWWHAVEEESDMVACYTRALEEGRGRRGDPAVLVDMMESLGSFFADAACYDAALPLLEEAWRFNRLKYGPADRRTAASSDHFAEALYHLGEFRRAEVMWNDVLTTLEAVHGPDDPALCPILDSLSAVAHQQREYERMRSLCRRSLAISETAFGADHPKSIDRLKNLGGIFLIEEKFDDAVDTFRSVVEVSVRTWGPDHPQTARNRGEYAYALVKRGRVDEAVALLTEAAAILQGSLGDHPALTRVLETLGHCYIWSDAPAKAEECYRRALAIHLGLYAADHPNVLYGRTVLASALRRQGRLEEAEALLMEVVPIQIERLPPGHSDIAQSVGGLIAVLELGGREEEAAEWRRRTGLEE